MHGQNVMNQFYGSTKKTHQPLRVILMIDNITSPNSWKRNS